MEFTAEEIAKIYTNMFDSVDFIQKVINDDLRFSTLTLEEKRDMVERNVTHLEITLNRDFWTTEDMTQVNAAISLGKDYLS